MTNEYTWGSIVPLIGGESIGMERAFGNMPEWLASFPAFGANEKHYVDYMRERGWSGDYHVFDGKAPAHELESLQEVDVIASVCPCAGLSSFSSKRDESKNEWMIHTAEYVLGTLKPRVFWGENAPRLSSAAGGEVRGRLLEVAARHGYSATFYKTQAKLHGIAQKRPRTFYFFWKSEEAPLLGDHVKENRGFADQIASPAEYDPDSDPMWHLYCNESTPSEDPYYKWLVYNTGITDHAELSKLNPVSLITHAGRVDPGEPEWKNYRNMAEWLESIGWHDQKTINRVYRNSEKLRTKGGGLWTHGITMIHPEGVCPAFIGVQPHGLVHPFEDRYLNTREMMRMMDMPEDMQMHDPVKNLNHLCQNVDTVAAEDVAGDVRRWLNGELAGSGATAVIQENGRPEKTQVVGEQVSGSLDGFM